MNEASERGNPPPLFILWQSLVVETYRSFFYHLAEHWRGPIALAAPQRFLELGKQVVECAPFESSVTPANVTPANVTPHILATVTLHIQIVWFRGLSWVLRRFAARREFVFLCLAEPYSLTALWAWFVGYLAAGKKMRFYCYALQNIQKKLPLPLRMIQSFIFRQSAGILACGKEQEAVLRAHGFRGETLPFPLWFDSRIFFPRGKSAATTYFLEKKENKFAASTLQDCSTMPCIGFAGALLEEKGIYDLLQCLEENPAWAQRFAFILCGTGPEKNAVEEKIAILTSQGWRIAYFGPVSAADMPYFYSLLDVLVVPSRTRPHWKEQFGRVIIEAQACGCVAVGSDSGEIPQVIADLQRVFPEGDLAQMAAVINNALENRDALPKNEKRYADFHLAEVFANQLAQHVRNAP